MRNTARLRLLMLAALVAVTFSASGCASVGHYFENPHRDFTRMIDLGVTVSRKPQIGLYWNSLELGTIRLQQGGRPLHRLGVVAARIGRTTVAGRWLDEETSAGSAGQADWEALSCAAFRCPRHRDQRLLGPAFYWRRLRQRARLHAGLRAFHPPGMDRPRRRRPLRGNRAVRGGLVRPRHHRPRRRPLPRRQVVIPNAQGA